MIASKAWAFVKKDFRIESSYKLSFLLRVMNSIIPLFALYFISKMIPPDSASLEKYGGSFFYYVLIGLAFARFSQIALTMFSESIRMGQMTGCLEAMVSSQTSPTSIVLMSSLYSLLSAAFELVVIFLVGIFVFGARFDHANLPAAGFVFLLSTFTFVSFGILSAACIILIKKGDPITWLFTNLSAILGGALFPVTVMPGWMQALSVVIPIKYALDALRLTIIQGYSLSQVSDSVMILGAMTVVLFPLSLVLFVRSIHKAKKDGTLMQY